MTEQPAAMRRPTIAEQEDMLRTIHYQGVPLEVAERATYAVFRAGFRCDSEMAETIRTAKHDAWDLGRQAGNQPTRQPNPYA